MDGSELLSIKEFAEYTGVKQHILRHYDDIGIFQPIMRGENGYRYYSPQQITALNMVSVLSDIKSLYREVGELQQERSPQSMLEFMKKKGRIIDAELRRLHDAYAIIHMYENLIGHGITADEENVVEMDMEEFPIFIGPENKFEKSKLFYSDFVAFCKYAREHGISLSFPIGGLFEDVDALIRSSGQPKWFFSTSPRGAQIKPAGHYIVGYHRGYYGVLGDLPQKLIDYAKEHNLETEGPVFVIYVLDEVCIGDPDRLLAQAAVMVKPAKKRNK
ncbi:MAG: MerR family transcriptional regulator [Clostridium sp.]|jgi:DNA-binding transcriptional MerR regulator|nr:MerR family transcriptional regulator [Clostridium sp.]